MDLSLKRASNLEEVIKMFKSRMDEYDEKQEKLQKVNPDNPDVTALSRDFSNFKTFVWKTLSLLKAQLELLSLGMDRQEAFLRRKVLLIHGVPEEENENPKALITDVICRRLHLTDFASDDIQVCHRLGRNKRDQPRPFLIRFNELHHRDFVWNNKTVLKGSGYTISEFLTKSRHLVFLEARKHFGVKNCWTMNSRITVLLPDKTRCNFELMSELDAIKLRFPSQHPPVPSTSYAALSRESSRRPRRK